MTRSDRHYAASWVAVAIFASILAVVSCSAALRSCSQQTASVGAFADVVCRVRAAHERGPYAAPRDR